MKKIIMYQKSIVNLDDKLVACFDYCCPVLNFSAWIREQAYNQFGIMVHDSSGIIKLDEVVQYHLYRDKSEWIREKMRNSIGNSPKYNEAIKIFKNISEEV